MKRYSKEPDRNNVLKGYEKQSFDKVWALVRPYRSMLFGAMTTLILFNMVGLTMPWMLKLALVYMILREKGEIPEEWRTITNAL